MNKVKVERSKKDDLLWRHEFTTCLALKLIKRLKLNDLLKVK